MFKVTNRIKNEKMEKDNAYQQKPEDNMDGCTDIMMEEFCFKMVIRERRALYSLIKYSSQQGDRALNIHTLTDGAQSWKKKVKELKGKMNSSTVVARDHNAHLSITEQLHTSMRKLKS